MRPFPLLRLADENPAPGAQKWRVVALQTWDGSFMSISEFKFLANPGDAAQPGTGAGLSSATGGGSGASAFDGNTGTEVYINYNAGNNYLEFDFNLQWDIKEIYYANRTGGWPEQSPRELSIQAFVGGVWTEKGHVYGIPQWATNTNRRYAVNVPADEAGGHRYWRFTPTSTYGTSPATEIEVEFLQADNTNIGLRANSLLSNPNGQGFNALDGVKTGDNYCNFNSPPSATPLSIDFGYKRVVDHVALTCRSGFLTQAVKEGRIDWSDDGATWTEYMTFHDVSPWTFYTGMSLSSGAALAATAAQMVQQNVGLTPGVSYDFSFNYNKTAGSKLRIANGLANGANVVYTSGVLANGAGTISGTFVAAGTYFGIEADTASYSGTIDNVVLNVAGGGPNLIQDGTFSLGNTPTSNQTRTFYRGVPKSVTVPQITGNSSTYGNLLTVDDGVWENSPTTFTKTWKRGATVLTVGNTYTPVVGDNNSLLSVETVAHSSLGDSVVTTSYVYVGGTQARYWRIRMPYGMRSDGYGSCASLELRAAAGGADLTQGAGRVYSMESQYGSQVVAYAFDNNAATYASLNITSPVGGHWIAVDLGAGHDAHVGHVTYRAEPSCGDCAHKGFVLEWSADGSSWNVEWDTGGPLAAMANGQVLTYTKPAPIVSTAPAISGDLSNYGNLVTCSDGTWKNSPTSYVKTWKDSTGTVVATGNTYTPTSGQFHTVMTCEVAATNDIGTTTTIVSFYVGTRVRSSSIVGGSGSSLVVAWPAGAVAGDRVVILTESAWGVNLPSGWTNHDIQNGSGVNGGIISKVLTSGDITAGSVTVTYTGAYGCVATAVCCYGAPTVVQAAATRGIASGGSVSLTSAQAGDEVLWFAGVRDGSAGTGTINVGAVLQAGDYGSNQAHGRVTNNPRAATATATAIVTHNGQSYFGGVILR